VTHSIAELRSTNPMWYFEGNYRVLMDLLNYHQLHAQSYAEQIQGNHWIEFVVVERTRYTLQLKIKHNFHAAGKFLPDLVFNVRVYLDAALAEVIAYQGQQQLLASYPYPNEQMFHPDEKRQANLLLHDWLSTWSRMRQSEVHITS